MSYVNIYAEQPSGVVEFYAQAGDQAGDPATLREAVAGDPWLAGMFADKVLVKRADLPQLVAALRAFSEEHPTEGETLMPIAGVLEVMECNPEVVAVGFNADDTAATWFVTRDATDDAPAEDRSYDTSRDTGHVYLTPATMVQAEQPSAEATPTEEPQSGKRRRNSVV